MIFFFNFYVHPEVILDMSSGTQKESSDNPTLFSVALVNHISESSHTFSHSSSLTVCYLYLPARFTVYNVYGSCNSLRSPQMKTLDRIVQTSIHMC